MLRVTNVKVSLEKRGDIETELYKKIGARLGQIKEYRILKEAIDARKPGQISFVYTVDVSVENEKQVLRHSGGKDITTSPDAEYQYPTPGLVPLNASPVVVGSGPAGLFAGLLLAQMGYKPLIIERGAPVDERSAKVDEFWQKGKLDIESNVQFGEGGAGTFSDGKLTTLIKDLRIRKVVEELVASGAPKEILYSYKPHVGTDLLRQVVKNLRKRIISLGGQVRFNCRMDDMILNSDQLAGVVVNGGELISCEVLVLAIGHSARDTFSLLHQKGLALTPKPFSVGVRIEHHQRWIDQAQYKEFAGHPNLGPAEYKLTYHSDNGRSAYSFCMCPGGLVVAATSEEGQVVTNGMSHHARDAENANSALLVGVGPEDFGSDHPLAGVEFQRKWERAAFEMGGRTFQAPAQLVGDFIRNRSSTSIGVIKPSYLPGIKMGSLVGCLPDYVVETLQDAIGSFDGRLKGFGHPEALLTGVETRSSSPLRIDRDDDYQSTRYSGVYPAGEGAGYAGGIVSAAVDGLRVAEAIISRYRP